MDLGYSITSVLESSVDFSLKNENYWDHELEAFEKYINNQKLKDYLMSYTTTELGVPTGAASEADIWIVEADSTPICGSIDAISSSFDITGLPAKVTELVNKRLAELKAEYDADPVNATSAEETTIPPEVTTTGGKITIVVVNGTTAAPSTNNGNNDPDNTNKPNNTTGSGTEKANEGGCAGFTAISALIAVICGSVAVIAVKKHY